MQQFDLLGFYDHLTQDYHALQALLGIPHAIPHDNANASGDYRAQRDQVLGDKVLMATLRDALKDDIAFLNACGPDGGAEAALREPVSHELLTTARSIVSRYEKDRPKWSRTEPE